ncbi:MAG: glycosyltransferase family 39 protein [Gammaproteobacteria bacterium]|nr:glycosyltransferase family 39 protein [Gammaproteobacteria bacterium]
MKAPAIVGAAGTPSHDRSPSTLWLAVLLGLFTVAWFASLGTRSLINPDEGRYASLSLAMMQTGDWVTPRLNGLLYFEKPALQYWIGALFFHVFGVTEFAARLWPGLAGFLTVLMTGFTAARLWGRDAGVRAFALAGSTTWIVGNSHFLTLDAGLTLFLTLMLCAVLIARQAQIDPAARRRWIWLAWAAMAGAVLSKGLVGIVIPGATLVVASLWRRDARLWRGMHWGSGLLIFLVLAAPWFVLVSLRNPAFAEFFFIHEHFTRFLTKVHQRSEPVWFYLPLLLGGLLPWTSGLPWMLRPTGPEPARLEGSVQARHLLIVWSAFVLLFFSASGSKLPSYILPMFPALCLLAVPWLQAVHPQALRWHLLLPTGLWLIALAASTQAARFVSVSTPIEALLPLARNVQIGAVVCLACAALAWWLLGRR